MSDFTYGNLILAKDVEIAKKHLEPNSYLIRLNDKWICRLARGDDNFNATITVDNFSDHVLALSEHTPVLFFVHPEDHGFGFAILQNKEIKSSLCVWYEDEEAEADEIFSNMNLDNFGLFGYTNEDINELKALFTAANYYGEEQWEMADKFMNIAGLEQMSFISWHYISDNEDVYDIIAKGD